MRIYHTSQNQVYSIHDTFFAQKPKASSGSKRTLHGNIYQLKLLMLFLKRGFDKKYNFLLSAEINEAEKFNDLVFQYKNDKKDGTEYRFLQAKHKQYVEKQKDKITVSELLSQNSKRPFSLQKYFISFLKIQEGGDFEGEIKYFIICTNTYFDFELRKGERKKTQKDKERWKNYFQGITKTIKDEILDVNDDCRRYQFINASNEKRQEVVSELYSGFKSALEKESEKLQKEIEQLEKNYVKRIIQMNA
ncbi:MAG: hypothetical protein PG981_000690 [Wolbachia endosymbiont of Ctenocephalides orientis wCori]|nr:MAG: hypothetical protein PG981_000690 [Wolbachia endosymbiont of Ctenocephalides orientis wCori]